MKRFMQTVALVLGLAVLLAPTGVGATGTEWIGGWAEGRITYYSTQRTVTNPSLPGPEVAFLKASGVANLYLGPNNCDSSNIAIMRAQTPGEWSAVAYFSGPTTFCISTASPTNQGTFQGTLAWD